MESDVDSTAVLMYPTHPAHPAPSSPLQSPLYESSCDPDSDLSLDNKKEDTYSDDPKRKGLGDAWMDIPMSQAIEFIPVLTPGEIKDIARYKGKVVYARINEQITTHKEKMSQSIATKKEKMSQSLTQQREKMSQNFNLRKVKVSQSLSNRREKMSQHREKMSQSFLSRREKMSQHREKMSQSFLSRRERMTQSLSSQKEKISLRRERVSMSFSQRRIRMSQTLTSQRERVSQTFSLKRDRSKQVGEEESGGAARVEHAVTQMESEAGTGVSSRDSDTDLPYLPLRDVNTSPENTPVCRKSQKRSQSCPNLYPLQREGTPVAEIVPPQEDNLSICSFATTVSAPSSQSDADETDSFYSETSFSETESLPSCPTPEHVPADLALSPIPSQEIEVPPSLSNSSLSLRDTRPLPIWAFPKHSHPLLAYSQLPDWYRDNECIRNYYRPPLNSFKKCFRSVGYWHTESGNIWSHLLGILIFLVYIPHFAYTTYTRASDSDFSWTHPSVISVFILSAILCLLLSTCFHTLMCHSNRVYVLCLRVDYCGIAFLIIGTYVPWFYYLFYCVRAAQISYISVSVVLGLTAIVTMIAPFFNRPKFRIFRALLFGCVGSFGVIPAFHAIGIQGFSAAMSLGGVALMFCGGMFYIVGAGIYAIRLPERVLPGRCDLLLQSHTIFHICVLIAATFHYFSLLRIQEIRLLRGGYCNVDINI